MRRRVWLISGTLLQTVRLTFLGVELARELLASPLTECLLKEFARLPAFTAGEAFGFDAGLASRRDRDFDRLQAAPPT